jgi:hypothetical protein
MEIARDVADRVSVRQPVPPTPHFESATHRLRDFGTGTQGMLRRVPKVTSVDDVSFIVDCMGADISTPIFGGMQCRLCLGL